MAERPACVHVCGEMEEVVRSRTRAPRRRYQHPSPLPLDLPSPLLAPASPLPPMATYLYGGPQSLLGVEEDDGGAVLVDRRGMWPADEGGGLLMDAEP